jgi:hypothetical protein
MRVWVLLLILALAAAPLAFVVRFHTQSTAVANNAVGSSHVISNASKSIYNGNAINSVNVINGSAPPGVPANNIVPLPPPFGNVAYGCADWYIMEYLESHGWRSGMPPPMLPMICWGSPLPQSMVQGIMSAVGECAAVGYEPLYYGNGYVVCINKATNQTMALPIQ